MPKPQTAPDGLKNRGLSPRQESAAVALASGAALAEAAAQSGAGQRTIKTWRASLPAFTRRVQELRAEMTDQALGRLVGRMREAADTLGYLSGKAKSETVRLAAARSVLELATKMHDVAELEQRISLLEQARQR
jgi:hypothetical protein